ncbi:MAG: hypothetical protein ABF587_04515 [Leuconostoc sp.]|uniref:hypothetical protein n=1 Tax=Leuconostoc sp. TaxID=1930076 RepID=UPI0039EB1685
MRTFVNKNDLLKIDLVAYILETDQQLYDMKDVEEKFAISGYMLRETVAAINLDIDNLFQFDWLMIEKGTIYQNYRVTRYHLYKLSQLYFNLSPLKLLLEKRVLTGAIPSYTTVQSEYGWSTSYFFAQKNQLTELVPIAGKYDFIQAAYAIYTYFDDKPSFSKRASTISREVIRFLLDEALIDEEHLAQKTVLVNFFVTEILNHGDTNDFDVRLVFTIGAQVSLPNSISGLIGCDVHVFMAKLLEILDVYDFLLPNTNYSFLPEIDHEINQTKTRVHPILKKFFATLDVQTIETLSHRIAVYSQRFSYKQEWFFKHEGVINLNYFRDIYPSVFKLLPEIVEQVNAAHTIVRSPEQELFEFNLIGMMFDQITAADIDRVIINVNFTETQMTNQMIISMLRGHINHANVYFTQNVSDADIFLSDAIDDTLAGEQVIWKKPPTLSDWRALGELLVKVKQHEA